MEAAGTTTGICHSPGTVVAIGTDIIECERIAGMLDKHGETFLHRVFTPDEIAYCKPHRRCSLHYAARWAAKEAVMKVLGTGWSQGVRWTDIEVRRAPSGAPAIQLHGVAAEIAGRLGIDRIAITMSHCDLYAVAFATGLSNQPV